MTVLAFLVAWFRAHPEDARAAVAAIARDPADPDPDPPTKGDEA